MRVGLLGNGRLGRSLRALLTARGVVVDLRGRGEGIPAGDVVVLCVPDASIAEAAAAIPLGTVILHTSGAAAVEVLRPHAPAGSFHPLMTFPGPEIAIPDVTGVPAAVAGDDAAVIAARWIADTLGMKPVLVPGDRRLYHAAAVMAGNFATVLLAEAAAVLSAAGVEPAEARAMLIPLAVASLRNAATDPVRALTGPIARGDEATVAAHRAALAGAGLDGPARVYELLTARARALIAAAADRASGG